MRADRRTGPAAATKPIMRRRETMLVSPGRLIGAWRRRRLDGRPSSDRSSTRRRIILNRAAAAAATANAQLKDAAAPASNDDPPSPTLGRRTQDKLIST